MAASSNGFRVTRSEPATFELHGELDLDTSATFDAEVTDVMSVNGSVTIDVSGLTYLDSSGLRSFSIAAGRLSAGSLEIRGAHGLIRSILSIRGFGDLPHVRIV